MEDRGMRLIRCIVLTLLVVSGAALHAADDDLRVEAEKSLERGVKFFRESVAAHGGYVYRYSADLKQREGEGKAGADTVWVQPPGTPAVGMAYVEAYERLGDAYLLEAARETGECLIRGQLHSGGWDASIEFDPKARKRHAYRVDGTPAKRARNNTSFDDQKTQAALAMLMRLDEVEKFQNSRVHEAVTFALESILKAQFPNGAWSQVYSTFPDPAAHPVKAATFPDEWPRTYPGGDYWQHYTLNDNALVDTAAVTLVASRIYNEPKYRAAAIKAADFLLLAQMPEPQPAWAQQYDKEMHPVWARKFEPPAISGSESQNAIELLHLIYIETGDRKYLDAAAKAIAYLKKSELPDGKLARFYELQTNRPLYFVKDTYELTYRDDDLPTHYSFKVGSQVARLAEMSKQLGGLSAAELKEMREPSWPMTQSVPEKVIASLGGQARRIIAAQDERGAWIEAGKLRYHGNEDDTREVIETKTFIKHLHELSEYLAVVRAAGRKGAK
jgi:hypothetical protein